MPGVYYPFDDGPGASITEDQWSYLMRDTVGTGVHESQTSPGPEGNELRLISLAEPGQVQLLPGRATIRGFHYQQGGTEVLSVTANPDPSNDRIDAVSLKLDLDTNTISVITKMGVASSSPVAPATETDELRLAHYLVRRSSNTVLDNEITDRRRFVGRRLQITEIPNYRREGDISYSPTLETWFAEKSDGNSEAIILSSDLDAHTGAADPHTQYAKESDFTYTTGSMTAFPLVTTYGSYLRKLNLPNGMGIVNLYVYGGFDGADDQNGFILYQIDSSSYRPNFSVRVAGHQYKFANSTDDYPLAIRIDPSGQVVASPTFLMGSATFIFNAMYFVGSGA